MNIRNVNNKKFCSDRKQKLTLRVNKRRQEYNLEKVKDFSHQYAIINKPYN